MVRVTRFSNVLTQAANDRQTTATDSATADLNDVSQCYSWPQWCATVLQLTSVMCHSPTADLSDVSVLQLTSVMCQSATADLGDVSALQLTSVMCRRYSWPQWCVSATADLSDVSVLQLTSVTCHSNTTDLSDVSQYYSWPQWHVTVLQLTSVMHLTLKKQATADLNDVSQYYSWPQWCISHWKSNLISKDSRNQGMHAFKYKSYWSCVCVCMHHSHDTWMCVCVCLHACVCLFSRS